MVINKILKKALKAHNSGDFRTAEQLYRKLLRGNRNDLDGNYLLGTLCAEQRRLEEAEKHLKIAAHTDPESAMVQSNLGNVYRLQGDDERAAEHYVKALQIDPDLAEANCNTAQILEASGDYQNARTFYQRSVSSNPELFQAQFGFAMTSKYLGHIEEAKSSLEKALAMQPGDDSIQHLLAALSGERPEAPPDSYVRKLFDNYAPRFEHSLVESLGYDAPGRLEALLRSLAGPDAQFERGLDLGCGTGLSGRSFRPMIDRLVGVDLSAEMIAEAKQKSIYDELHVKSINDYLGSTSEKFDLLIAADVLIYVGKLEELFRQLYERMRAGAWLLFSTEAADGGDYQLRETGRYAHSRSYIEMLAESIRLTARGVERIKLRKEFGTWIEGDLYLLQNTNQGTAAPKIKYGGSRETGVRSQYLLTGNRGQIPVFTNMVSPTRCRTQGASTCKL